MFSIFGKITQAPIVHTSYSCAYRKKNLHSFPWNIRKNDHTIITQYEESVLYVYNCTALLSWWEAIFVSFPLAPLALSWISVCLMAKNKNPVLITRMIKVLGTVGVYDFKYWILHLNEQTSWFSTLVFSYDQQERFDSQLWYCPVRERFFVAPYGFLRVLHLASDPKPHRLEVHLLAQR